MIMKRKITILFFKNAHSSMKLLHVRVNKFMPRVENFRFNLKKKLNLKVYTISKVVHLMQNYFTRI
jgi:hypothetical protein